MSTIAWTKRNYGKSNKVELFFNSVHRLPKTVSGTVSSFAVFYGVENNERSAVE